MYEKISEFVEVLAAFRKDRAEPVTFKWRNHYYQVKKVNMIHAERKGREKVTYFSVSDDANAYRLSFSSESFKWKLEEIAGL